MKYRFWNLFGIFATTTLMCGAFSAFAAQTPNPRGGSTATTSAVAVRSRSSSDQSVVQRSTVTRSMVSRNAVAKNGRVSARGAVMSNAIRGAAGGARSAIKTNGVSRSATMARSATPTHKVSAGVSRAALSRATAVFSDVSKIGGGYAQCRDAYATCMDQFCANANDKYRRCFCSSRFTDFRDTEDALDQAKTLLMQFEDNNLNAVDKTAAEVNAMYSATVGEMAIKKDTSGAAKILDQIGDLLSGKKKASKSSYSSGSLGVLSFDISGDVDDIWGNGGSDGAMSIFGGGSGSNLAELEGTALYDASNKQCLSMVSGVCESNAVLQMARSSYSIMITQDCNAYEKKIDSLRESVKQTVRTAEKYLREARLEEYRSHNSADVNECIAKVKTAITADTACGANYKRCLDYTGAYINPTTGDAVYSQRLFEMTSLITLDGVNSGGDVDVLKQNPQFDKFLEQKRMYASGALDTCRDIANTVWTEFKRGALIEIAQAQDEKIESVKMSCVSTMAECYDKQSSALKGFDDTTAQVSGAMSAYAARQMCMDKVIACASLYGNTDGCSFDGNGKLVSGNSGDSANRCGLTSLLNFVDTVDTTRISEGCETALQNHANELCTPTSGDMGYPWNCRSMSPDSLAANLKEMAALYCGDAIDETLKVDPDKIVEDLKNEISQEIESMMYSQCVAVNGRWYDKSEAGGRNDYETAFYMAVYGRSTPPDGTSGRLGYGTCVRNTVKASCEEQDAMTGGAGYAKYNASSDMCTLSNEWYQYKCENVLDGYWDNGTCYTAGE